MITWIQLLEYVPGTWLTLEGSIGDGGEVVSREVEHEKLQESLKSSNCDIVQKVVCQIQLEHHR
jgi:hypothetical protein